MNRKIINIILIVIFIFLLVFSSFLFIYNKKNKNIGKINNSIDINDNIKIKKPFLNKQNNKNDQIKIYIGGDIMLSRAVGYFNKKKGFNRITKKYNPVIQTGGIVFFNLESPFAKKDKDGFHASYYFGANTGSIEVLESLKKDNIMMLSLANNIILEIL